MYIRISDRLFAQSAIHLLWLRESLKNNIANHPDQIPGALFDNLALECDIHTRGRRDQSLGLLPGFRSWLSENHLFQKLGSWIVSCGFTGKISMGNCTSLVLKYHIILLSSTFLSGWRQHLKSPPLHENIRYIAIFFIRDDWWSIIIVATRHQGIRNVRRTSHETWNRAAYT